MERGILETTNTNDNKPLAAKGLISYRYYYGCGFVMIGATDHEDALREANRSISGKDASLDNLEIWNGTEYEKVT